MPAIQSLFSFIGINPKLFSKEELLIIEADLLAHVYNQVKELFRDQQKEYFKLMKFTTEMENTMLDANYPRFIINDILLTEEYTLAGIACYTQTPEDIIYEIATGCNTRPCAIFLQKLIELHRSVRYELYQSIIKKIADIYIAAKIV